MGVYRTDFVVYGYKIPNHKEIDFYQEQFLSVLEGHKGEIFNIVVDFMCGKYAVFGIVLSSIHEQEGDCFNEISFNDLDAEKVKEKYRELFGEPDGDPKVLVFNHYS